MNTTNAAAASHAGADVYARVGVESGVMSASPHQLIVMLFDGLQLQLRKARLHMENGQHGEKGKALSSAIDIVNRGLLAALDRDKGADIAEGLELIYDYCVRLLLQANLHNDLEKLDEASRLLGEIGESWRELGNR